MTTSESRLAMPLGEAMYSMRAIRRFRPDAIPDEDLHAILEAATRAPSGSNLQPWHFVVVCDDAKRAALAELYREAWWAKRRDAGIRGPEDIPATDRVAQSAMKLVDSFGTAPAVVLVCATAPGVAPMTFVIPAAQNLLLAARALGIGGTITTLHADVDERVHELFEMPGDAQVVYCIPLGYPQGKFGPLNRKPVSEVVSQDTWGTPSGWE
jgi:nitroreductase